MAPRSVPPPLGPLQQGLAFLMPPLPRMTNGEPEKDLAGVPEQIHTAFAPHAPHALLRSLPPERLSELRARSDVIAARAAGLHGHLLAFLSNTKLQPNQQIDGGPVKGMAPPVAIWAIWTQLGRAAAALSPSLNQAQSNAVDELLASYRGLYLSALLNAFYRANRSARAEFMDLAFKPVQDGVHTFLDPHGPNAFQSGFVGHTIVTRCSVPCEDYAIADEPLSEPIKAMFAQIEQRLGTHATAAVEIGPQHVVPLNRIFHEDTEGTDNQLTDKNIIICAGQDANHVTLRWLADGHINRTHLAIHDLNAALRHMHGRQPLFNVVKVTMHNGGALSQPENAHTRSFDRRYLFPLPEAKRRLAMLWFVTVTSNEKNAEDLFADLQVDAHMLRLSAQNSPWIETQRLGNCTVHSQMLYCLYQLQHAGENSTGQPRLTPAEGLAMFQTLWGKLFEQVLADYHHSPHRDSEIALNGEVARYSELLTRTTG